MKKTIKEQGLEKKSLWKGTQKDIDELAEYMHERYEKHAKENSWETQKITRIKFENLPEENKKTMQDLAIDILIWREKALKEQKQKQEKN